MKRLAIVLCAALLCAGLLSAATLLTEDFNYGGSAGALTTVSGGTWVSHSGTAGTLAYQASGLTMAGYDYAVAGTGAAVVSPSSSEDAHIAMGSQTGEMYFSALVNVSAVTDSQYFLHFMDSGTGFRARVFTQIVSTNLQFGISANGTATSWSATSYSLNTTYLLVVHYTYSTNTARLYVFSAAPPATEPASPDASDASGAAPSVAMQSFAIRESGGGTPHGPTAVVDGIRVGTTWAETVTPVQLMSIQAE